MFSKIPPISAIVCVMTLWLTQSACLFSSQDVKFNLVRTDTVGVSKGEIGYIANGEIYMQNPAGAQPRQVSFDGVNKLGLVLRGDRKQAISTTISTLGYPKVVNFDPNLSTLDGISSSDYATPNSFGYVGLDTLYFLTPRNTNKFISDDTSYTNYIRIRLNMIVTNNDSLQYLCISRKNDLVVVLKQNATNMYKMVWLMGNNTQKTYITSQKLQQPKWSPDANILAFPSDKGIFMWKRAEDLPKMTIFDVNIRAFALNPTGSEIAYTKGNDTIQIRNLSFSKSNRALATLPAGVPIRDIDWK
jgi:Tol biopolymer transport system component